MAWLFFGCDNDSKEHYPKLVFKPAPFTDAQIDLASNSADENRADVITLSDRCLQEPYDELLSSN